MCIYAHELTLIHTHGVKERGKERGRKRGRRKETEQRREKEREERGREGGVSEIRGGGSGSGTLG